jgi:hypothetical protein
MQESWNTQLQNDGNNADNTAICPIRQKETEYITNHRRESCKWCLPQYLLWFSWDPLLKVCPTLIVSISLHKVEVNKQSDWHINIDITERECYGSKPQIDPSTTASNHQVYHVFATPRTLSCFHHNYQNPKQLHGQLLSDIPARMY